MHPVSTTFSTKTASDSSKTDGNSRVGVGIISGTERRNGTTASRSGFYKNR